MIRRLLFYCSIQLHTHGNNYTHAYNKMCANTYLSVFIFFIFTRTATITRKLRTKSLLSHLVRGIFFSYTRIDMKAKINLEHQDLL